MKHTVEGFEKTIERYEESDYKKPNMIIYYVNKATETVNENEEAIILQMEDQAEKYVDENKKNILGLKILCGISALASSFIICWPLITVNIAYSLAALLLTGVLTKIISIPVIGTTVKDLKDVKKYNIYLKNRNLFKQLTKSEKKKLKLSEEGININNLDKYQYKDVKTKIMELKKCRKELNSNNDETSQKVIQLRK